MDLVDAQATGVEVLVKGFIAAQDWTQQFQVQGAVDIGLLTV